MENNAAQSLININIPAKLRLEIISFSFSRIKENIRTTIIIRARWQEGEKPVKIPYNIKGTIVNTPAIFFDLPEIKNAGNSARNR